MMEGAHLIYELWDVESGNLVSAYEMESDALAWVREAVDLHGHPFADALALVRDDDQAEVETIAVGAALVARARSMVAMADRL